MARHSPLDVSMPRGRCEADGCNKRNARDRGGVLLCKQCAGRRDAVATEDSFADITVNSEENGEHSQDRNQS